jgi:hypothetical protein
MSRRSSGRQGLGLSRIGERSTEGQAGDRVNSSRGGVMEGKVEE